VVSNTRWAPLYDLHAISEENQVSSSVSLHYRVQISQSTGEHWNDTAIILSTTATDALSAGIPEPKSLSIQRTPVSSRYIPAASPIQKRGRGRFLDVEAEASSDEEDEEKQEDVIEGEPLIPTAEGVAFVSRNPVSVSYAVDGKSTILSDGEIHKVSVAQLPFEASITHVTVPRQETLAYIQVTLPSRQSEYTLI
jgi:uncharacterized protein (TIGR02231 family)